ncbi:hexokinase-7 [Coniella lustricola]|uniref:Phosphotransferase n=1 Tax=Coniella lustricola TaxID=2025994 RepID=A0A2T3AKT4_9PEZI|nr:hexokinase-7 [Coniella lustricola]
MASREQRPAVSIVDFLAPLHVDDAKIRGLALDLADTFTDLSANSDAQFLPTPIGESLLRRVNGSDHGRYLAIDIGGTNLRVGFVELLPEDNGQDTRNSSSNGIKHGRKLRRLLERSWPIGEHLKNENAESLFSWIGQSIATVVDKACAEWDLDSTKALPLGVAFSFPVIQNSVSQATIMSMGKGFAITSKLDLGSYLLTGYEQHRKDLPPITIAAIANDAIATLVSFIYQFQGNSKQKASMGLICGTGSNATIPLKLSSLHPSKRPQTVSVLPGESGEDVKIVVNTEWSINGSLAPLKKFGLVSRWDRELDLAGETPGFQPLEYMTSGRYLGELGRLIFVDYLTSVLHFNATELPAKLKTRFGLSTTFLSHFSYKGQGTLLEQLEREFPPEINKENRRPAASLFTDEIAEVLYRIAVAVEVRAAGIVAASTLGLLICAGDLPSVKDAKAASPKCEKASELFVGYTGGCITGFQEYLKDCQGFLDRIIPMEYGADTDVRVLLAPCHDGGIIGAGILVPASLKSEQAWGP